VSTSAERELKKREELKKQREQRQERRQREKMELQQAFNTSGELDRGWMREILNTDDLEEKLQPNTVTKIQAMLNRQWIIANLTEAETHDRIWWLEAQKYKIYAEHPRSDTGVEGPMRAFLMDDNVEQLRPLSARERNAIDQVVNGLKNMVTRARGGFERQQINTNIARTETGEDQSNEGGGGMLGFFE